MTLPEFSKVLTNTRQLKSGLITKKIRALEGHDQLDLLVFLSAKGLGEAPESLRNNLADHLIKENHKSNDGLKKLYKTFVQFGLDKYARDIIGVIEEKEREIEKGRK